MYVYFVSTMCKAWADTLTGHQDMINTCMQVESSGHCCLLPVTCIAWLAIYVIAKYV